MLYTDQRLPQNLQPHLQRILILDPSASSAKLLSELLRELGARQIITEGSNMGAIDALKRIEPQIIFAEAVSAEFDGLQFTRNLRHSALGARKAPVIMVTASATAQVILGARNAGVHEFLRKPFTSKDLVKRIEAVSLRQRDWIQAEGYVGPDRRRFNSAEYAGSRKRGSDKKAEAEGGGKQTAA